MTERASGPDRMHSTGGPDTPHRGRCWPVVVAAGYVLVAGWLVWLSRSQVNPDGVAYVRIAEYYAAGRFDLAVASHWGPLLSWLLVPAVWLDLDPLLTAKAISTACGLGAALAAGRLARRLSGGRGFLVAFAAAALLVLAMLPDPVTPDVLLAGLMGLYFLRALRLLEYGRTGPAFVTGLIAGLAYLAKHYALPFVAAHLLLTFVARAAMVRRSPADGALARPFLAAAAGLLLVATPWATVLSAHDGTPTVGSTLRHTRAFSPLTFEAPLPLYALQRPRQGRITSWENPSEILFPWPTWSPLAGWRGLADQAKVIAGTSRDAAVSLGRADLLGMLVVGLIASMVLAAVSAKWLDARGRIVLAWTAASVLLFVGGYVLILVLPRFLWPVLGTLAALTATVTGLMGRLPGRAGRALPVLLGLLLIASAGGQAARTAWQWARPDGLGESWDRFRQASLHLDITAPVAANEWHKGLFASYYTGCEFLGRFEGTSPGDIARQLQPFGPACVLVFDDGDLARNLQASGLFQPTGQEVRLMEGSTVAAFQFIPPGRYQP